MFWSLVEFKKKKLNVQICEARYSITGLMKMKNNIVTEYVKCDARQFILFVLYRLEDEVRKRGKTQIKKG